MDKRFLRAYTDPSGFKMLGKRMYPWCLKYRVWLTALESPMITGGTVGPEDLLIAVNVCSESPVGEFNWLERWRLLRLASNPPEFKRQLKLFSDYTLVSHWPKFWEKKNEGTVKGKGIPWPLSVVTNLVANGIEEQRAWEMPECQAIWMNSAFAVRGGADINVLSTEEEEHLDELEKLGMPAKTVAKPSETRT